MKKQKKDLIEDMKEIKRLVKECPEAVEYLSPVQKKVVQALMRTEGNTSARRG